MTPLLTFLHSLREWQIIAVAGLALVFGGFSYFVGQPAPAGRRMLVALWSAFFVLVALSALGFIFYAWTSERFDALPLFPSMFVVIALFVSVGLINLSLEDRDFSKPAFAILGFVVSLVTAALICAVSARL